jgi:metallophosphoesterase (TIGR00282 family)
MQNKVAYGRFIFFKVGWRQNPFMRILMVGDVVGHLGRQTLSMYLPKLSEIYAPDFIVVNGENAANNGRGISKAVAREIFDLGVQCITLGNHAWGQTDLFDFIDDEARLVRPANYPIGTPGRGYTILTSPVGKLAVINLLGRTFMSPLECPFRTMDVLLKEIPPSIPVLVDFHAETTSEKQALAWYVDGRVSAVIGTHTHVQTADERVLPKGTGYLTDVGMVGPRDGVIGMERTAVIRRFISQLPVRFEVAKGSCHFHAVLIHIDKQSKKAIELRRIRIDEEHPLIG